MTESAIHNSKVDGNNPLARCHKISSSTVSILNNWQRKQQPSIPGLTKKCCCLKRGNRDNVKQMNQRDAWDIISSTFNVDILETLNQFVAIHLQEYESLSGRRPEIPHQPSDSPTKEILTSRHVGPRIFVLDLSRNKPPP